MQREKILKEFSVLNCIIDQEKLEFYVDFCIQNNLKKKKNSSSHHILPRGKTLPFSKFSNLKETDWNKSELSYYNHYLAHYLLTLAVKHISVYASFCAMHNKDYALNKIKENELITEAEYNEIFKRRNKLISERRCEKILVDGKYISRASHYLKSRVLSPETKMKASERMKGDKNIVNIPGVLEKIRNKKSKIENGTNLDKIGAENAATTMKKEFIDENGNKTTIYKETAKKISTTITSIFYENGIETSIAKKRGSIHSEKLRARGFYYRVKNVFDSEIDMILSAVEVRNISAALETKTKENYLGKSKYGQSRLIKQGKSNLIGLYSEKLP